MNVSVRVRTCLGGLVTLGAAAGVVVAIISCSGAPTPFLITGQAGSGNEVPTLTITQPFENITRGHGDNFLLKWTDEDADSNAMISFLLVNTVTNTTIILVDRVPENDTAGLDELAVGTSPIPVGTYYLLGVIDDLVNDPVTEYAMSAGGATGQRVIITIVSQGQAPPTQPPIVTVIEPAFNLSVSQDDVLVVVVQPTEQEPVAGETPPFDPDSDARMYILLDTDQDPNNDDPANPDLGLIIPLREVTIQQGAVATPDFEIRIDLGEIPPRLTGDPYYIRVTLDDATNRRVHAYAAGTINVTRLAAMEVDSFDPEGRPRPVDLAYLGSTISGGKFYGFNPGANVGSNISHVGDFDADGVDDFVLVAQFGNPRNYGLIGEAYLIYGRRDQRFGGALAVNTVGETISGVIFEAPPVRTGICPDSQARTEGITDVSLIRDLSGDGRPEILFGLPHVHCAWEGMDFDPGDSDIQEADTTVDVEVTIRQGRIEVTADDELEDVDLQFFGVDDLIINSAAPNTTTGSASELSWQDSGPGQQTWALIKFRNLLSIIPDDLSNIELGSVRANLSVRVFGTGGDGTVHQCLTGFNEQTTFSTFAKSGGGPQGGDRFDPLADYVAEGTGQGGLGGIGGDSVDVVEVDVSDLLQELIEGLLSEFDNELRFIIVPDPDAGQDETFVRSSEYSQDEGDRPTLTLQYTRENVFGERNCYPDDIVNNSTNDDNEWFDDTYFYAGGMALIVNSQNRDNAGEDINPLRLESTVVTLELVGQQSPAVLDKFDIELEGGVLFARADNSGADPLVGESDQGGRISGVRIVAGHYDHVDARLLNQGAREGLFAQTVSSLGDINNDGIDEIMISAPLNERYFNGLFTDFGFQSTQRGSTRYNGSIVIIPGNNYNLNDWRDKTDEDLGTATTPFLDQHVDSPFGSCQNPPAGRTLWGPRDEFQVFAENVNDRLGGAVSAGDFNLDGVDDILCGAPLNDHTPNLPDTGAAYVIYGRNVLANFHLDRADDPLLRPPMLRIRGKTAGDRIGWANAAGLDVNGDRRDDVFISSPFVDGEGKVDNGFAAIIFGGVFRDGDRRIDQIDTKDVAGAAFFGTCPGDRFGHDVSSAGDFNHDNFGDILIVAPGEIRCDLPIPSNTACGQIEGVCRAVGGRPRLGVVYLIFGGPYLENDSDEARQWRLDQVGISDVLPGIVFLSPYEVGGLDEAAPITAEFIGDINGDGFSDIAIGNPMADFVDPDRPQEPEGASTDPSLGRRSDAGEAYIIYGNNFGRNRELP